MPRLGYQKVRTGCMKCRQRRVKCDEKRPCSACSRHGVRCSLMDVSIPREVPRTRRPSKPPGRTGDREAGKQCLVPLRPRETGHPRHESSQSPLGDDPFPYLTNLVKTSASAGSESWTSDLELMHHFTAITWKTLPRGPELFDIWQLELPTMSFKHPFLAHQVLAFSANHMALLHPAQRNAYSIKASQHQSEAVKGLREALHSIDSSLCHAVFAHASLLSINAFASLSEQTNLGNYPGIDDLLHVFLLMRGMNGILGSYENIIKEGPLGKLLQLGKYQSTTPLLLEVIQALESMLIPSSTGPSMPASCEEGITSLIEWIKHARQTASLAELRVIMSWPTRISDEFVQLVRERFRPALQVLACYCRILESTGVDHWYLRGWGKSVAEGIKRILA